MNMVRLRHWLVLATVLMASNAAFATDIKVLTDKFLVFSANEKFEAELYVVSGEPGYTLVLYRKDVLNREIVYIIKRVDTVKIVDDGYKAFVRVIGKTSTEVYSLILLDARTGQIRNLGQFNYVEVSPDGRYLATTKKFEVNLIVRGQIYDTNSMDLLAEYKFDDLLSARLGRTNVSNNFIIELLYNVDLKGFEVLFDHFGELGRLTCTAIISIPELKFSFTDRKNELLKRMGLSK